MPTEFRLFVAGWNETENGRFLFDDVAAQAVMSAYGLWGVDLAIDLEHQMLEPGVQVDPTAKDARGWCALELRADGSLWAVNVRWTADGAARLSERRQRYVSPAFMVDPETSRVTSIINVAITAIPATHNTPALVAARKKVAKLAAGGMGMDPKLVADALDALVAGDAEKCSEILKGLIAAAASGDPDAATEDAPPPVGDGGADEATEMSAAPPPADGAAPSEDEKKVAASALLRETGASDLASAVAQLSIFKASHLALETERQELADERKVLEAAERRQGCIDLVTKGGFAPAVVWADEKCSAPKAYLAAMPIDAFRAFVGDAKKASKSKAPTAPASAAADGDKQFQTKHGAVTLSASELRECERAGAKPEVYAANKAQRLAREKK